MKLIDILKQELPKRGGWPEGVDTIIQGISGMLYSDGIIGVKTQLFATCPLISSDEHDIVTREQYETPEWNGEGLPPVGVECEFYDCEKWFRVTMMYGGSQLVVLYDHDHQIERSFSTSRIDGKFRPIRNKRDEAEEELFFTMTGHCEYKKGGWACYMTHAELIYDAIAAGKIPGVVLVDSVSQ